MIYDFLPFRPEITIALCSVLGLIVVDTALGVIMAISQGHFDLRKLPQFLRTNILPYAGGLLILALAGGNTQLQAIFFAAAAATSMKFLLEIKDKIKTIYDLKVLTAKKR